MKIMLLVPEFPPNIVGGGGVVYKALLDQYIKKGHSVTLVQADYKAKSFLKEISISNKKNYTHIKVPLMPFPKFGNFITATPPSFTALIQLLRLVKKINVDVIHAHGVGHIFIDYVILLSKIPVVLTVHGVPDPQGKFANKIYNLYQKTITTKVLNKCFSVTAVSSFTANQVKQIKNLSVKVIGNGLDTAGLKKLNIKCTPTFTILSVGRIIKMKGFDKVVKLLPYFLTQFNDVLFIIAGRDAGFKDYLIELSKKLNVENKVKFVGFVNKKSLSKYLSSCDLVAITSSKEPFNIFALESMYFEKTILTTFGGGLKEVIGGYSKAVDINCKNVYKQVMLKKNTSSNFLPNMYSWNTISDKYLNILNKSYGKK